MASDYRRGWLAQDVYSLLEEGKKKRTTSTALHFYHTVLELDHLHYGLWDGDPLTIDGLKAAQERYTNYLLQWIPESVDSVLDVGCGTGATAVALKNMGLAVEGVSPDPFQQKAFSQRLDAAFHRCRFQDLAIQRRFDLIFMSESCQYVPLDALFVKARSVAPNGYLLVSDYFVEVQNDSPLAKSGHHWQSFLDQAERDGFAVKRLEDVTDRVTPTLDLANQVVHRYLISPAEFAIRNYGPRHPLLFRILFRCLRRYLTKCENLLRLVDSEEFKEVKRYRIVLLEAS